ncbi:hypothetical protein A4F85_04700 [Delftia sp. GW456-R20]|uniref:hypothetical protein n=1 Tax=Delftia sp. GW456-R20 TaxID=1827145 RepID=UPI0007AE6926|nr:hypothetical protein [Delftia sp. GW456-R20]KZK32018.1 hypothetical protein A4F85_04700 [Delftia sp. GW456-R20]
MQSEPKSGKPITSTDRIYDAVRELRSLEQIATRETVAELTGLKMAVVDDRLRTLVDDGKLKRLLRGVYELVEVYPATRVISKTVLPTGYVKYDIGDFVLTLTPVEDRVLAQLGMGAAGQAILINSANQHLYLATELAAKVEKLERELKAHRAANKGGDSPQTDWIAAS